MALERAATETMNELIRRVRNKLGDPAVDALGVEIPVGLRKFTDQRILNEINEMLIEMSTEMMLQHSGEGLVSVTLEYVEGRNRDGCPLPPGCDANGIFMVEDRTGGGPSRLNYVSPLEIENFVGNEGSAPNSTLRVYTLIAEGLAE